MDIFNKHYEKIILAVCLVLMVLGLLKVGGIVREANEARNDDIKKKKNVIREDQGNMVDEFDPSLFVSKEDWIQRVKTGKPGKVRRISELVTASTSAKTSAKQEAEKGEALIRAWDRRYFNILTRHSLKPIEAAEARYRLAKNEGELKNLKESIAQCKAGIAKREKEQKTPETDAYLRELHIQLEGFEALQENIQQDIIDLNKRLKYISMFCTPQGSLVDPQEIVCCPNPKCGGLMLSQADVCPFCGTEMPAVNPAEQQSRDSDMDGLPDTFELHHKRKRELLNPTVRQQLNTGGMPGETMAGGAAENDAQSGALNPYNAADAHEDFDGDSFTNLEEYRFGTDIDDPESFPQPANYVRIVKFERDKLPFRFMGIKPGRRAGDKGRAMICMMRNYRYVQANHHLPIREQWSTDKESWELVRIGKKFEATDGKTYVLNDMGKETVDGKEVAFVKITDYVRPVKARRSIARKTEEGGEGASEAEAKAPETYVLYEGKDGWKNEWFVHLVYLANRSTGAFESIRYNRYSLPSGARSHYIKTRFKLGEKDELTLSVPIVKKEEADKKSANGLPARDAMGPRRPMQGMNAGAEESWTSSPEVEMKTFSYTLSQFNAEKKTVTLNWGAGKDAKSFAVPQFNYEETYELHKRQFRLLYEGGNAYGDGMMGEGAGGPGMGAGPGGQPMGPGPMN